MPSWRNRGPKDQAPAADNHPITSGRIREMRASTLVMAYFRASSIGQRARD